jgi:16S rRNA (guanine966-N2)-methyltransferase
MTRRGIRISGGRLRGRSLAVPTSARPTSARLREALFDIWRPRIVGARLMDLFAGTGAVGFEALSRGADFVVFVESDRAAVRRLQKASEELAPDSTRVCLADLPAQMHRVQLAVGHRQDLIFADPPYDFVEYAELLATLGDLLREGGEVAVEHSMRTDLPDKVEGLERSGSRAYGENRLTFYSSANAA